MDLIDRDVIKNSEYIISYYKKKGKKITNLELQKLAYFLESIYMVCTNEQYLYEETFSTQICGPINSKIYSQYKHFGKISIELEKEIDINPINLIYIKKLYNLFKNFSATQLVNLSHSKNSPWYNLYKRYDGKIPNNEIINKNETKIWFETLVDIKYV